MGRIIKDCAENISNEEAIPLAEFLINNTVARKAARLSTTMDHGIFDAGRADINEGIIYIVEKTPPKKRAELVKILTTDNFARPIIGKSNPHYYVAPLSEGLLPQEFNSLLATSGIFADVPHDDFTEGEVMNTKLANTVALNLLLDEHPKLRDNESLNLGSWSTIEDINVDETVQRKYKERAWEYLEIAYKHCKGAPEVSRDNKHDL